MHPKPFITATACIMEGGTPQWIAGRSYQHSFGKRRGTNGRSFGKTLEKLEKICYDRGVAPKGDPEKAAPESFPQKVIHILRDAIAGRRSFFSGFLKKPVQINMHIACSESGDKSTWMHKRFGIRRARSCTRK